MLGTWNRRERRARHLEDGREEEGVWSVYDVA